MLPVPESSGLQHSREARPPLRPQRRVDSPEKKPRERPQTQTSTGPVTAAPHGVDPPRTGCPRAST
eukprot:15478727-Alexandrium_andersonii.AAC.1